MSTNFKIAKPIAESIKNEIDRLEFISTPTSTLSRITTGFNELDNLLMGFQPGNLYLLASLPCVGKTAFLINILINVASNNNKALLICPGMSKLQVTQRVLSCITSIKMEHLAKGQIDHEQLLLVKEYTNKATAVQANLIIWDNPVLSVNNIRVHLSSTPVMDRPLFIVIDDVDLIRTKKHGKENNTSLVMLQLMELASEFGLPILVGKGIRSPKKKESTFIQCRDLRKNEIAEQYADVIMFLYRPEYYEVEPNNMDTDFLNGETHIRVAKNRTGPLDTIKLKSELQIQKFYDWHSA